MQRRFSVFVTSDESYLRVGGVYFHCRLFVTWRRGQPIEGDYGRSLNDPVSIIERGRGLRRQGPPIGRSADFPHTVVCFIKMHSDAASK